MTTTLVLAIGASAAAVLVISLRQSGQRSLQTDLRRRTIHAIKTLHEVAVAGGAVPHAADAITEVLHLRSCRWEPARAGERGVPVLSQDGLLSETIQHRDRTGLNLPALVHLPARPGRFTLMGPQRSATLEERLVAVAIANIASSRAPSDLESDA